MTNVPAPGSKWRNKRTREVHTVIYHPCGAVAGFSVAKPGKGYGSYVFTSDDSDESFTSRFEAAS